ncbi:DJ-1/PfpI family protein [Micromonospora sp. DR5-3]|uniref:DJ-1/PfpI family protein n=1 Tax=unclassified Micromonospora TaxID=2617518 RepID=UPI0016526206|nr:MULTISPECIES: DJ-1/PfpI family protein [unclassified Micromonospora]MCW3820793.1 DJ-1/PfpI family protein [Micromonospora sp. DR5-3]
MQSVFRFCVHLLEMVVAMLVGMFALGPLWALALPTGVEQTDVHTLTMATDMAIGMAVWMRVRGHGWAGIGEMTTAMYAPFIVLLVPYWFGAVSASVVMTGGHVLMGIAMVAVMLRRRSEYTHRGHRLPRVVVRIAAVVLALAVLPVSVGAAVATVNTRSVYAPAPSPGAPAPASRPFDPTLPTAVVVLGAEGANVADALGPFEVLAATGRFNVLTAAPTPAPVTLTGGLDLVPDVTFESLATRLGGRAADVIVVPAMPRTDEPAVLDFLRRQADGGALMLSVCWGGGVAAAAGVLDGHTATSHWYYLDGLEKDFPDVRWQRGVRYVDDGQVISTAGVLSGIDGTLRVIERLAGTPVASAAAEAVGWRHYSPGTPLPIPVQRFSAGDTIAALNLSYRWDAPTAGVLLIEGVGELELASVFVTYTEAVYAARTLAVSPGTPTVHSRHGLTFVPRATLAGAPQLDRLLVPGAAAAARHDAPTTHDLRPTYLHATPGFAFDGPLRDIAVNVDVASAAGGPNCWSTVTCQCALATDRYVPPCGGTVPVLSA